MDSMTKRKVASLMESGSFNASGMVLTAKDGKRAIIELGAVRWMTKEEFSKLMLPTNIRFSVEHGGKTYAIKPCPWCAAGEFSVRELGRIWNGMGYGPASSYEIIHHCEPTAGQPTRAIMRAGRDLESAVSAWNNRK